MKINLTKLEEKIIAKINRYTYHIEINEKNNDPNDLQSVNLSALLYNAQILIELFKSRGINAGDSATVIKEKLENKNI